MMPVLMKSYLLPAQRKLIPMNIRLKFSDLNDESYYQHGLSLVTFNNTYFLTAEKRRSEHFSF